MVPHANWHHTTVKQSEHTKYTVLANSSVLVASVVNEEWRWQPQPNFLNWCFNPLSPVSTIECTSSSGRGSSGGVRCSWSQARNFSCNSWPPSFKEYHLLHNGGVNIISRSCALIQIKYVLPNCVTCPSIRTDPGVPPQDTRLRLVPGFRDPGYVLIQGQVAQYGNPYLICIIKLLITQMKLGRRLSVLLHSRLNIWLQWVGQGQLQEEKLLRFEIWTYIRGLTVGRSIFLQTDLCGDVVSGSVHPPSVYVCQYRYR